MADADDVRIVLLTGATGYVGGRLLAELEALEGISLRCLARRPEHLAGRVAPGTEVVAGDVLDPASLAAAMLRVHTAYYLVHSMASAGAFEQADRIGAANFGSAASAAGVRRIVYLGGLADSREGLSSHMASRLEVGELLRGSGVPVLEFRSSIILGSGSLSFEMIRALIERLPVMVTPKWVSVPAQPIAVTDLLRYLVAALDVPGDEHQTYEIGGASVLSYGDLMLEYARQRGLKRWMIRVPVLTPRLSSWWLQLVTPLYARVGRRLIDSMRHASVVQDDRALRDFRVEPMGAAEAISQALGNEDSAFARTRWNDARSVAGAPPEWGGVRLGNRLVDSRLVEVGVPPGRAFGPICRIGGGTGWYYARALWWLRGVVDLLVGGVGMRRGRRDPQSLRVGDVVDCWRVEAYAPDGLLRLAAEMKLPGRAWLEFEVKGCGGGSTIRQTAVFDPLGLSGILYWYALWPFHQCVFGGMLRGIARAAEREPARG